MLCFVYFIWLFLVDSIIYLPICQGAKLGTKRVQMMQNLVNLTKPITHMSRIPQYTIQNRNVHIPCLNSVLRDMGQVHLGICEIGVLIKMIPQAEGNFFSICQ